MVREKNTIMTVYFLHSHPRPPREFNERENVEIFLYTTERINFVVLMIFKTAKHPKGAQ